MINIVRSKILQNKLNMTTRGKFKKLLATWGLSEYYNNFAELDLDEKTAVYLKDSQLESILGTNNYYAVIKFKLGAKKYRDENVSLGFSIFCSVFHL